MDSLEEITLRMSFIDSETCRQLGDRMPQAEYARCITEIELPA